MNFANTQPDVTVSWSVVQVVTDCLYDQLIACWNWALWCLIKRVENMSVEYGSTTYLIISHTFVGNANIDMVHIIGMLVCCKLVCLASCPVSGQKSHPFHFTQTAQKYWLLVFQEKNHAPIQAVYTLTLLCVHKLIIFPYYFVWFGIGILTQIRMN